MNLENLNKETFKRRTVMAAYPKLILTCQMISKSSLITNHTFKFLKIVDGVQEVKLMVAKPV